LTVSSLSEDQLNPGGKAHERSEGGCGDRRRDDGPGHGGGTRPRRFLDRHRAETPGRLVGMHWSNPPHLIPMIEVVPALITERAEIAQGLIAVRKTLSAL